MKTITLQAAPREESGKGPNRRLRAGGRIPAVLYGRDADPIMLSLDDHSFRAATAKLGDDVVMFELTMTGSDAGTMLTLLREIQRDPVTERFVHVDLMRVDTTRTLDVAVAIHGIGEPAGVLDGGVLEQGMRTVQIRCLPSAIPERIELDLTALLVGQSLHVSDLSLGEGVEILASETDLLFTVVIPRIVEEEEPEVEGVEGEEGEEGAEGEEGEEGAKDGEEKKEKSDDGK